MVEQWEQDSFKERTNEVLERPRNDSEKEAKDPRTKRAKELQEETAEDKVVLMEGPGSDLETATKWCHRRSGSR